MRTTRHLEIGSADRVRQGGSLRQVPVGIVETPGPGLDDPKIHQRDGSQLTSHHDRLVRSGRDRRVQQVHLLDHFRKPTASPGQRQPLGCGCYRQTAAASRRDALAVRLGERQLSRGFVQLALRQLNGRVGQGQLRVVGCCPRGNDRRRAAIVPS